MFNEMLIREKFMELVNQVNLIFQYIKEQKEKESALIKEIKSLKEMVKKLK